MLTSEASQGNFAFLTTKYEKIAKLEHFFFIETDLRGANVPSAPSELATGHRSLANSCNQILLDKNCQIEH